MLDFVYHRDLYEIQMPLLRITSREKKRSYSQRQAKSSLFGMPNAQVIREDDDIEVALLEADK
jgi:hypothetical protein